MIRWQKKRANIFPRWMCGVFVSYWLEFLISIHSSPRRFWTFQTVRCWVKTCRPRSCEDQFYPWRKKILDPGRTLTLENTSSLHPKVSFWKTFLNQTGTQASKHVDSLLALSVASSRNRTAKLCLEFHVPFACIVFKGANYNGISAKSMLCTTRAKMLTSTNLAKKCSNVNL